MPNEYNEKIIADFRASGGQGSGPFTGMPMLLLTTTGSKSGKQHTTPLVPLIEGDKVYVIASMGGAPKHPTWYGNLVANSDATVERGAETYAAKARVTAGDERGKLFALQVSRTPTFGEYEKKTERTIPVVELVKA